MDFIIQTNSEARHNYIINELTNYANLFPFIQTYFCTHISILSKDQVLILNLIASEKVYHIIIYSVQ